MGKKTPLYQIHIENNAKMIDFSGWDMPLHYGSQIQEHHQVRSNAGIFDVSHMTIIDIIGCQARKFLRYLLANDVNRLQEPGKALYSCMLNEQGGVLDDLIIYFMNEEHFRLVVNAATREKDMAWIQQQAQNFSVSIEERSDLAMLAVQGSQAPKKLLAILPKNFQNSVAKLKPFHATWNESLFIARTGYTGEDGFEIILANQIALDWANKIIAADILPIGMGARDTLRLEAGMNLYGSDMDENYSPLEAGLSWTVAFKPTDRDFIGRVPLEIQLKHGKHKIMLGLILQAKGILRNHQPVFVNEQQIGEITSGSFSPTLNTSIAFARLQAGEYQELTVKVRNKQLVAKVVKLPFVRHGKACY
ncbi:MAG: glycine cleavage system aminomethyltransferase GcvT [Thiomargarita sp.]|nr:glycine cleavage system aminomethyltransferase GcvT [Thiomargarita sp.]